MASEATARSLGVRPLIGRVPWAIVAGTRKTFERVTRLPLGGRERAKPDGGYIVLIPTEDGRGERVSVLASAKVPTFDKALEKAEALATKNQATAFVLGRRAATNGRDEYRPILMAIRGSRVKQSSALLAHVHAWVSGRGLLKKGADYGGMLGRAVIRMAETFSSEGHSGMSANAARAFFNWAMDGYSGTHTMMLNDEDFEIAKAALKGQRSESGLGGDPDPDSEFGLVSESLLVDALEDGVPEQVVEALVFGDINILDDLTEIALADEPKET